MRNAPDASKWMQRALFDTQQDDLVMAIANFPFQSRFHVLDGCTCTVGYDAYTPLSYETFEFQYFVNFFPIFLLAKVAQQEER